MTIGINLITAMSIPKGNITEPIMNCKAFCLMPFLICISELLFEPTRLLYIKE